MKITIYNQEGEEVEKMQLPVKVFGLKINKDLLHQAIVTQLANRRQVLAHTKDRSEVRGGGRKPWRQKGTGRARHGSIRSPIWRGGGVTFGPIKDRVFKKKINKKMKKKALLMALSGKMQENELIVLNDLKISKPKTALMNKIIDALTKVKKDIKKGALIALTEKDDNIIKATKNIPQVATIGIKNLNVVDILSKKYLVTTKKGIEMIEKVFGSKTKD